MKAEGQLFTLSRKGFALGVVQFKPFFSHLSCGLDFLFYKMDIKLNKRLSPFLIPIGNPPLPVKLGNTSNLSGAHGKAKRHSLQYRGFSRSVIPKNEKLICDVSRKLVRAIYLKTIETLEIFESQLANFHETTPP